jgi:hypothetical protein
MMLPMRIASRPVSIGPAFAIDAAANAASATGVEHQKQRRGQPGRPVLALEHEQEHHQQRDHEDEIPAVAQHLSQTRQVRAPGR